MLLSEIITYGLREGNSIPVGVTPTTVQLAEGLVCVNGILRSLFGHGVSEELTDWMVPSALRTAPVAADFPQLPALPMQDSFSPAGVWPYPPQGSRIVVGAAETATVYFPEYPNDGARMGAVSAPKHAAAVTFDGNGRYIDGATTVVFEPEDAPIEWLYRADLGAWKAYSSLALTSESPLPAEFDDLLIARTAMRLAPRYGNTVAPTTVDTYMQLHEALKTRYAQAHRTIFGSQNIPNSYQGFPNKQGMV